MITAHTQPLAEGNNIPSRFPKALAVDARIDRTSECYSYYLSKWHLPYQQRRLSQTSSIVRHASILTLVTTHSTTKESSLHHASQRSSQRCQHQAAASIAMGGFIRQGYVPSTFPTYSGCFPVNRSSSYPSKHR